MGDMVCIYICTYAHAARLQTLPYFYQHLLTRVRGWVALGGSLMRDGQEIKWVSGLCGRNGKREYGVCFDSLAAFILLCKKDEEKNCASKETPRREIPSVSSSACSEISQSTSSDPRPDDALRLASFGNGFFFSFFSSPVILLAKCVVVLLTRMECSPLSSE